jgi:hypothetical protein
MDILDLARNCGVVVGEDGPDEQFEVSFHAGQLTAFAARIREEALEEAVKDQDGERWRFLRTRLRSIQYLNSDGNESLVRVDGPETNANNSANVWDSVVSVAMKEPR